MRQYVVVKITDQFDARNPGWLANNEGRFIFWQHQNESAHGGDLSRDHQLFFADTLEAAQHLAKRLAEINMGCKYMACEGGLVFECKAAPVLTSKWSKAGLLPA